MIEPNLPALLDAYSELEKQIHEYFGYGENWQVFPIYDSRSYFWYLDGEGPGTVHFADTKEELLSQEGKYYEEEIYTYHHMDKWVYRGKDFTMILVDTCTDGNNFASIFDNSKELTQS